MSIRGPVYMPVKDSREQLIQYGLKNKGIPPKYENITLQTNRRFKKDFFPNKHGFVKPVISTVNGMEVELIEIDPDTIIVYDIQEESGNEEIHEGDDTENSSEKDSKLPDAIIGMGTIYEDSLLNDLINNPTDLDEIQT